MTRGRRTIQRTEAERRCIVSRAEMPKDRLIRFVLAPDATITPDLGCRLPGRGLYVAADAALLRQAVAKGAFSRALKAKAHAAPDLPETVERLLARRLVELLALARKSGAAVAGRETTLEALRSGKAALLVQAADGSVREMAELRPPCGPESRISCLSGHELGMAFGRDRVIHAAVLAGGLSDRIKKEALRLSGFRGDRDRQLLGDDAGEGVAGEGPREKG